MTRPTREHWENAEAYQRRCAEHDQSAPRSISVPETLAATKLKTPASIDDLGRQLTDMNKRLVRIETRATNALRYLGLRPGEPVPDAGKGSVAMVDGILMVTGMDVAVRDIALAAVLSDGKGDIPIFVNNHQWGVIHVR